MTSISFVVVFVAFSSYVVYKLLQYYRLWCVIEKLPGPPACPFIGNVMQFITVPPKSLFWMQHGLSITYAKPRMCRLWLGWKPFVLIYGTEEAEKLLSNSKQVHKAEEYRFLEPWMGLGLLTSSGEMWRKQRRHLTPAFHFDILKDFLDVFSEQAKTLVVKMQETVAAHGRTPVDYYDHITRCALDIICETAMGCKLDVQNNPDSPFLRALHGLTDIIYLRQISPWIWNETLFWYFGRGKEQAAYIRVIHDFSDKIISDRLAEFQKEHARKTGNQSNGDIAHVGNGSIEHGSPKRRRAFLDLLLGLYSEDNITFAEIKEEVDTFMFAVKEDGGHDTTTAAMNWALHLIGAHPEVQAQIHRELDEIFGDDDQRDITLEDVKRMEYLERCIKEALRLFPSVPNVGRKLSEPMEIAGYTIPSNTQVVTMFYTIHRDEKFWPDADVYDPDRFLPANCNGRHPYAYVPFAAGSRNCIGQRFALLEEKTVLSSVFRHFTVTSAQRRDQLCPTSELVLRPSAGIRLVLEPRRKHIS